MEASVSEVHFWWLVSLPPYHIPRYWKLPHTSHAALSTPKSRVLITRAPTRRTSKLWKEPCQRGERLSMPPLRGDGDPPLAWPSVEAITNQLAVSINRGLLRGRP